jgi:hypothetical protein
MGNAVRMRLSRKRRNSEVSELILSRQSRPLGVRDRNRGGARMRSAPTPLTPWPRSSIPISQQLTWAAVWQTGKEHESNDVQKQKNGMKAIISRAWFLLLLGAIAGSVVQAQAPEADSPAPLMTLDEANRIATSNNRDIRSAHSRSLKRKRRSPRLKRIICRSWIRMYWPDRRYSPSTLEFRP